MKHFEVELQYKIGTIFETESDWFYHDNYNKKYIINGIEIDFDQDNNIEIIYLVKEEDKYSVFKEAKWRYTNKTFSESYLNSIIKEKFPYKVNIEFKYDVGDIVISGVNGILPSNLESWKDSGPFVGDVIQIINRRAIIDENNKVTTQCSVYYEIVQNGKIYIEDNKIRKGWPKNELYLSLISDLNWDQIIDWKCQEMSKKMWREDIRPLYTLNGETVMSQYHSEDFMNPWTALFHYLGKEEYAINLYLKYVEDRLEGRKPGSKPTNKKKSIKKEPSKIDNIFMELSDKEKEELLKKLMNS